eukprot:2353658-Alexandrium_andersonii.AAC.1
MKVRPSQKLGDYIGLSAKRARALLRFRIPLILIEALRRLFDSAVHYRANDLTAVEYFSGVGVVQRAFAQ